MYGAKATDASAPKIRFSSDLLFNISQKNPSKSLSIPQFVSIFHCNSSTNPMQIKITYTFNSNISSYETVK